jgi:formylglycine-generating enzyme required for sulfatase activity
MPAFSSRMPPTLRSISDHSAMRLATGVPPGVRSVRERDEEKPKWEKAARGTDVRRYPWGSASPYATRARIAAGWNPTAPVDSHYADASPYGVLDMAGNAWEWVSSAYRAYPWRADDGRENLTAGPVRGTGGGGHDSSAEEITNTRRRRTLSRAPPAGQHNIGFRCAR